MSESEVRGRQGFKPIIGSMLGMGLGQVAAWLTHTNITLWLGMGMLIGVTCGYCIEESQPKRSRILLGLFTLAVIGPIIYLRLQ